VPTSNMDLLEQRIARLEEELSRLTRHARDPSATASLRLRKLKRPLMVAGIVFCSAALAATTPVSVPPGGNVYLQQSITYNSVSTPPPSALESLATWTRDDSAGANNPGFTTQLLSLIADGSQPFSNQWPLYVELRGTTSSGATQFDNVTGLPKSQSAGATVRSIVRSPGSPWTVGFHSEIAHGQTGWLSGTSVATNGTSILFNGEMRSFSTGGVTTGVNLLCVYTDSTSQHCGNSVNIQTQRAQTYWQNGIHFDNTSGSYISGNIGIYFDQAQYNMGIDLANNSLRMNAGQKIILEKNGTVYIWDNPARGVVEVVRNGVVVASF
jgi:hypothetical protein